LRECPAEQVAERGFCEGGIIEEVAKIERVPAEQVA
jgi:hypothetical protein